MFGIGIPELLVILLICLLVFGADKLPEIGKMIGKAIHQLKNALKDPSRSCQKDGQEIEDKDAGEGNRRC